MTILRADHRIRELARRLAALPYAFDCQFGLCPHDHTAGPLSVPGGMIVTWFSATEANLPSRCPDHGRHLVVPFRFRKRSCGGYTVHRADNGRDLGWVCKRTDIPSSGGMYPWDAHIARSAFLGETLDDTGDLLDEVPTDLYHGVPGSVLQSRRIDQAKNREMAAWSIVSWLVRQQATAVTGVRTPWVRLHKTRAEQHFSLGEGRRVHCSCSCPWPCPKRAHLATLETTGARP